MRRYEQRADRMHEQRWPEMACTFNVRSEKTMEVLRDLKGEEK
jgi:hypothetical protein